MNMSKSTSQTFSFIYSSLITMEIDASSGNYDKMASITELGQGNTVSHNIAVSG